MPVPTFMKLYPVCVCVGLSLKNKLAEAVLWASFLFFFLLPYPVLRVAGTLSRRTHLRTSHRPAPLRHTPPDVFEERPREEARKSFSLFVEVPMLKQSHHGLRRWVPNALPTEGNQCGQGKQGPPKNTTRFVEKHDCSAFLLFLAFFLFFLSKSVIAICFRKNGETGLEPTHVVNFAGFFF